MREGIFGLGGHSSERCGEEQEDQRDVSADRFGSWKDPSGVELDDCLVGYCKAASAEQPCPTTQSLAALAVS